MSKHCPLTKEYCKEQECQWWLVPDGRTDAANCLAFHLVHEVALLKRAVERSTDLPIRID